jgi:hypothetical protein
LSTDDQGTGGLTSPEAAARLGREGPNRLPPPQRPSAFRRFADQPHFFAVMLWMGAVWPSWRAS